MLTCMLSSRVDCTSSCRPQALLQGQQESSVQHLNELRIKRLATPKHGTVPGCSRLVICTVGCTNYAKERHSYYVHAQNTGTAFSPFCTTYCTRMWNNKICHKRPCLSVLGRFAVLVRFFGRGYGGKRAKNISGLVHPCAVCCTERRKRCQYQCFGHETLSIYLSIEQSTYLRIM